ncbi:MAG: recombinase family protein [Proteocatella sp.]
MAVIGYARVSTDKQDADRQRLDIYDFALSGKMQITEFVAETISSRKADRQIYDIVDALNKDDVLIVTELSRLARSMIELNEIVSKVIKAGATIKAVVGGYTIDDSIQAQALVFAFGIASQVERDMISERTKSALAARKAQGVTLGRPVGTATKVDTAMKDKGYTKDDILKFQAAGVKATALSKMLGVDARTVRSWIKSNT